MRNGEKVVRSRAPLRVGFAGGGTDISPYCDKFGGSVLNATINLFSHCTIERWDREEIHFSARDQGQSLTVSTADPLPLDGKLDLHKAAYNHVSRVFLNGARPGLRVVTHSDAPPGSGLGTSSTFVVSLLRAYQELFRIPWGEYDLAHAAYEIERLDCGIQGGRQDQYAAAFGGFNFIEFYANDRVIVNPLRVRHWIINELESSIILYFTGASRSSSRIIEQQGRVLQSSPASLEAMHTVKRETVHLKEAVLKGDLASFARHVDLGWQNKKKTADCISNPMIEGIYQAAIAAGATAGKVCGAGGGGTMMFFVDPQRRLDVEEALHPLGGRVMPFQFSEHGAQAWTL